MIDPVTGVVSVADGSILDYETATFHNISVRAISEDGSSSDASYRIDLIDSLIEDDPPISEPVVGALVGGNYHYLPQLAASELDPSVIGILGGPDWLSIDSVTGAIVGPQALKVLVAMR